MRGTGKKLMFQESGKSCYSKAESGSKLITSLKLKKGRNISCCKKLNSKSKSHVKTIGSMISKRPVTDPASREPRNDSKSRKIVSRKILNKAIDTKSSRKTSPLGLQGKALPNSSKRNGTNVDGEVKNTNLKKRKKKRRQKDALELDEASRLQRRTRYLMIKMKLEQNLIDAYSGEGWKGQSREKIKPEKELQRAKKQILKCKLGIRDAIHHLDSLSSEGCIEDSVIAPDGSVHHEHIFCAKCKLRETFPDNDIILCDGTCNCAFHQKCLDPPLDSDNIPPGDQGWFCKLCECKMEILEAMNAHLGTHFSMDCDWQDVFKEAAAFPDGGNTILDPEEEWPSDDSDDGDYNPDRRENSSMISGAETDDNVSDDISISTSLSWSLDGELFSGKEGMGCGNHFANTSLDSDESTDGEIICGPRQRRAVDYKKLYDEMFGKDPPAYEQASEDEDWGPAKRKRREKESVAASTLMTLYESEKKCPDSDTKELKKKSLLETPTRRPFLRMPRIAAEKLRQVFDENELPSRAVKENLSKELGLDPEKVEIGKQLHSFKDSRLENVKKNAADVVASKGTSAEIMVHAPRNVKRVFQRRHQKSVGSVLKKKQQKRSSLTAPANSKKDTVEFSDDVSLKKLLEARTRERKRVNVVAGDECQAAEMEMERLCKIMGRLESIKQKMPRLKNDKAKHSNKSHLFQRSVIYVPIAELREKV
ncbi:pathogenesis-related homeodomain protein-like isoform X2 [Juglans microcarpa x Juglans regia]|uniref:pathogenesis-related homeodomain protein-like isoform X2 n=1 Tax=Juglans microcarpa x Juglans regia TaxID=2249226 RepID=UPI001B7F25FD|nr:pathogenesis-related homeodomain protein-like isoform X2 [Juglans microcarpa x Juglans regia]